MGQAVDEESFGGALRTALGIGFGSDGSELSFLVIAAGDDVLSGEAVGDGVVGDGGFPCIGTRTGAMLRILNVRAVFFVGQHANVSPEVKVSRRCGKTRLENAGICG